MSNSTPSAATLKNAPPSAVTVDPYWKWPSYRTGERNELAAVVLWTLADEGPITSESGRATAELLQRVRERNPAFTASALPKILADLESGVFSIDDRPLIKREMNVRRTHEIALHPDVTGLPQRPASIRVLRVDEENGVADAPPEPEFQVKLEPPKLTPAPQLTALPSFADAQPPQLPAEPVNGNGNGNGKSDEKPPLHVRLIAAMRILNDVAIDLSMTSAPDGDEDVRTRLAEAIEVADKWRKRAQAAEETATARAREVQAVRRQNAVLQANIDRMLRAVAEGDDSAFRDLDKMMREKPHEGTHA